MKLIFTKTTVFLYGGTENIELRHTNDNIQTVYFRLDLKQFLLAEIS